MRLYLIAWATALGLSTPVLADHIPGHHDDGPTFPVPLPGADVWNGWGALHGSFIGPAGGTQVTRTVFDITWVQEGDWPASDLLIDISVPVNDDLVHMELTGADLGFGDAPGTYHAALETDLFNGAVWQFFGWPSSLIDMSFGGTGGPYDGPGHFEDSWIVFDVIPVPAPGAAWVLGAAGAAAPRRRR